MYNTFNQHSFLPAEFDDELINFACDYSYRARFISGVTLPVIFIILDYFLVLGLPIKILIAAGIFEAFINQPHRFILKRVKNISDVLLTNIIIDIFVIALVVYYSGGITIPFVGFVFLIAIVFNGIMAGISWALLFALLSSLFIFILATLELYTDVVPVTELSMEVTGVQLWLIAIAYTVFFILFAILVHLPSEKFKKEIRERYRANNILAESERKYRELFEESKDAVYMSSPSGHFIEINPAGIELFGFEDKAEALSVDIPSRIYINADVRDQWRKQIETYGFVKDFEVVYRRKDGEQRIGLETASAVRDKQGNIIAYRGIIRDITEKKRLEEHLVQSQRLDSLGYLAGGIAHDFNNILTIIQGSFSVLRKRATDKALQQYIELGEKSVERGSDIARRLIKFARIEEVQLRPISISEIAEELVKVIEHTFEKTIKIETHIADSIPLIQGDRGQIYQMFLNLCINARDAINERPDTGGKGTIGISIDLIDSKTAREKITNAMNRDYVRVSISDTGVGIEEDLRNRVFDPFFTTKPIGKGTGLGLSVVYGVVKSHNGFIDVDSKKYRGTTFTIYFPAVDAEHSASSEPVDPDIKSGSERILIVEDEDALRMIVTDELEQAGYSVLCARDGNEAIDIFQSESNRIDCILLDIGLPNISGKEVLQYIRSINRDIPVIVASGFVNSAQREELQQLGAQAVMQKPYRMETLVKNIREQLDIMK